MHGWFCPIHLIHLLHFEKTRLNLLCSLTPWQKIRSRQFAQNNMNTVHNWMKLFNFWDAISENFFDSSGNFNKQKNLERSVIWFWQLNPNCPIKSYSDIGDAKFRCALWTFQQHLALKILARCGIYIVLLQTSLYCDFRDTACRLCMFKDTMISTL